MGRTSTTEDQIERLIVRLEGAGVCDDCIAARLDLASVSEASMATRELGGRPGFECRKGDCSLCGEHRTVIRHAGRQGLTG